MFAGVYFGEMYFAGEQGAPVAPPAPTPTRRTLVVACATKECAYPVNDFTLYNLDDALYFNGVPLSILAQCPTGYYCPPGLFPRVFTYPPGTFVVNVPPDGGFPIVLSIHGCESDLNTVLPSGSSPASIQSAADQLIQAAAEQQARCDSRGGLNPLPRTITLSAIDSPICEDTVFFDTISASGGTSPYTFSSPDLPAWLTPSSTPTTTTLSGTPPAIGSYTFTITVTSAGAAGQRTYTLDVVGIAESSPLPNGTKDAAYAETLTAPSISGTLTWSVTGGDLPTGLSLNDVTGAIYGTPTVEETANFTIQVSNGTITCSKEFAIEIASTSCPVWADTAWNAPIQNNSAAGTSSGSGVGGVVHLEASSGVNAGPPNQGQIIITGSVLYTGPGGNCCLTMALGGTAVEPFTNQMNGQILQDGNNILHMDNLSLPGVYTFTLVAGVGSVLDLYFAVISSNFFLDPVRSITLDITFGPCP